MSYGAGSPAYASVSAPKMSPVPSPSPDSWPLVPPGVLESMACPYSWPTTSIPAIHSLALLCPMVTELPSQYALRSPRPTLPGKLRPLPLTPLRPSHWLSMSHCFWAANMRSVQPVSLDVALPVPQESEDFVNTLPVL